jgi:hypothetical protein
LSPAGRKIPHNGVFSVFPLSHLSQIKMLHRGKLTMDIRFEMEISHVCISRFRAAR